MSRTIPTVSKQLKKTENRRGMTGQTVVYETLVIVLSSIPFPRNQVEKFYEEMDPGSTSYNRVTVCLKKG